MWLIYIMSHPNITIHHALFVHGKICSVHGPIHLVPWIGCHPPWTNTFCPNRFQNVPYDLIGQYIEWSLWPPWVPECSIWHHCYPASFYCGLCWASRMFHMTSLLCFLVLQVSLTMDWCNLMWSGLIYPKLLIQLKHLYSSDFPRPYKHKQNRYSLSAGDKGR